MSNTTKVDVAEATVESVAAPAKKEAPKFTLERLRQNCMDLFGVTSSTYDGAVCGLSGTFTVDEMKKHIKVWQGAAACPAKKEGK